MTPSDPASDAAALVVLALHVGAAVYTVVLMLRALVERLDPNAARDREAEAAEGRRRNRADARRRAAERANDFACLRRIRAGAPKRGGGDQCP